MDQLDIGWVVKVAGPYEPFNLDISFFSQYRRPRFFIDGVVELLLKPGIILSIL